MVLRRFAAGGLVGVLTVGLLAAGCNPDPGPSPTVSPPTETSAPPTGTPTPTPTENAEEMKQRVAFEAAEKAYRANWTESGRLSVDGGATKPTKILLDTSAGQYLDDTLLNLRTIRENGLRASSSGSLVRVQRGAYGDNELVIRGCEDYRKAILRDKDDQVFTPKGTRVYDQTITVKRLQGVWKLNEQITKEVKSC